MPYPIRMRSAFGFAFALALAAGLLWFILEGDAASALEDALATLVAALPLPYAVLSLLARRTMQQALARAKAQAEAPDALATLRDLDTVLLSKRLFTIGEPHIKELVPEGLSNAALLTLAASAEQESDHPYARVLSAIAEERRLRLHRLSARNSVPHAGVEALLTGQALRVGRLDWLEGEGVHVSAELATRADQLALHGLAIVGVALGSRARGLIAFEEDFSENAKNVLARLGRLGVSTVLLTRGSRRYGTALVRALGLTEAKTALDEGSIARELQLQKARGSVIALLMPSTQTADTEESPLKSAADLVITVGNTKTDEARGLVLSSLSALPALIEEARRTAKAFRSSLRLALAGFLVLVLPAFGLIHAAGGPFVPPAAAGVGLAFFTALTGMHFLRNR